MTLRERFQRLTRKSLYSSSSSSSSQNSSSSASSTNESRAALSSGATTPLPVPISASTPHPLAPILNPSTASPSSSSQPSPISDSAPKSSLSLLSKTLTWRSSHGNSSTSWSWGGRERRERRERKKTATENKAHGGVAGAGGKAELPKRRIHPSERPLTEANLRQQEALSQFKWEFGRKGPGSLGGWSVESGISPCGSRRSSYDLTVHEMPLPPAAPTS